MNWSDPNFVAFFAAWGQWAGAIGSLLAIGVAIWIALRSSKESQRQSQQNRYDAARPILVVSEGPFQAFDMQVGTAHYSRIITQQDKPYWIDWNPNRYHRVALKNVGTGPAFDVMSVLFGPESLNDEGKCIDTSKNDYWQHKFDVFGVGDKKEGEYYRFKAEYSRLKRQIEGYSLLAPPQPLVDPADLAGYFQSTYVCRLTTTYHDIFKRKHISIFDLDLRGSQSRWVMTAILDDIRADLRDLETTSQLPRNPFLKRLLKKIRISGI